MRILLVGASGTIGRAVEAELEGRHEVVSAGRHSGDVRLDIYDSESIRAAFGELGPIDAVISATGAVQFAPFAEMQAADYEMSLRNKLMGQVILVLIGREHDRPAGSFTLTSGLLDDDPTVGGTAASMVNGSINAFVLAASIEMPAGQRINAVSPGLIEEALDQYAPFFRGFEPVPEKSAQRGFLVAAALNRTRIAKCLRLGQARAAGHHGSTFKQSSCGCH